MKRFRLLIVFLLFRAGSAWSQEYSYVNYNTRDGLAGSVVYCMLQDDDGFMWFGTESGLSRFDGSRFTNFTMADGLPDNEIIKLFTDSKKRIWIVPFKNSLCYYLDGRIHTPQNDPVLKKLPIDTEVFSVAETGNGDVVVTQRRKIIIIKPNGRIVVIKEFDNTLLSVVQGSANMVSQAQVLLRYRDEHSILFCAIENDRLTGKFLLNDSGRTGPNHVILSPDLYLWATPHGIHIKDNVSQKQYAFQAPEGILRVEQLNDSILAISSTSITRTYNFREQKQQYTFFSNRTINGICKDNEGNMWFSTLGEGIYRLGSTEFKNLSLKESNNPLLVSSLLKTNHTLYIGTERNWLWGMDLATGTIHSQKLGDNDSQGKVTTIDSTYGGLLVGTDRLIYFLRDNKTKVYNTRVSVKATSVRGSEVYLATSVAAYYMDLADPLMNNLKECLVHDRTTAIFWQDDTVYIGTLNGLYAKCVYLPVDKIVYYGHINDIFKSRITGIARDRNGVLWMATYGKGIAGYQAGRVTKLINTDHGLTSNICRSICISDSTLWVGTDKGLNKIRFTGDSFAITRFTRADGLASEIINAIAVSRDTVYVGTPAGLTWFAESKVFTNSICVLRMTSVQSDKKKWVSGFSDLSFDHYDNNIRFDFAGISFKSAGEITYRYRLLGIDDQWRTTTASFLTFPTLPSGQYELQLQAINKFGVRSGMLSVKFGIAQLLWEKTWFRLLCMVLLGVGIWIFVQQRIQRIKKREALKSATNSRIAELEQMALKAQMNPHFIFNTLNSIQQYIFDRDVKDANKFIIEFSKLIRLTMEISSKTKITIGEELNYISTYLQLEKRRFEGKFDFRIEISSNDLLTAYIPPIILQPYIENSIRHGVRYRNDNAGMVTVHFNVVDHYLVCTVEDNGVGREASKQFKGTQNIEYQSKGMTLTARRIEMMNRKGDMPIDVQVEDLYDDMQRALGTKVVIRFPLHEA